MTLFILLINCNLFITFNFYGKRMLTTITFYRDDTIASASEDGTVLFWDVRTKEYSSKIIPSNNPAIKRPDLGNWVGSVTITKDWMVKL